MSNDQTAELTPDQEYQGKLKDATSFGGTIYAFTLQPDDQTQSALHIGPFEFGRPIEPYVGQQVSIRISGVRTEQGIFSARMRWMNPKPIDRKGSKGKSGSSAKSGAPRRGNRSKARNQGKK
jgi:hypothetical protein